jgi:uncharacterized protein YegP (UPF0339 family)
MPAQYILQKNPKGQFYFRLTAANNEPILASEQYETKSGALNGIESVKKNSPDDARYVKNTAKNGKFYFNLRAANNQVIGASEMYNTEEARETGIKAVKKVGPTAPVIDKA